MKKLYIIAVCVLLVIGFSSCVFEDNTYYDTDNNKFVVTQVLKRKGMIKMTSYQLLMLDASGLGETTFWVVDSLDKYQIGDRLELKPYN